MTNLYWTFEEGSGYLIVRAEGEWTSDTLRRAIQNTATEAKNRGFTRILADTRKMGPPKPEFSRFQAGVDTANHFGPLIRVAVVYRKEFINKLAEDAACNRGARMRVLSDFDKALSWLMLDPA